MSCSIGSLYTTLHTQNSRRYSMVPLPSVTSYLSLGTPWWVRLSALTPLEEISTAVLVELFWWRVEVLTLITLGRINLEYRIWRTLRLLSTGHVSGCTVASWLKLTSATWSSLIRG